MSLEPKVEVEAAEQFRAGRIRVVATTLVALTVVLAAGTLYSTTFDKNTARIGSIILKRKSIPWYLSSTVIGVATFLDGVQGFVRPYLSMLTFGRILLGGLDSAANAARRLRTESSPGNLEIAERRRKGYHSESARFRRVVRRLQWKLVVLRSAPVRRPLLGKVAVGLILVSLGVAGSLLLAVSTIFLLVRIGVL